MRSSILRELRRLTFLLVMAFVLQTPSAFARLPKGSCIFYGQARDQYGWPLIDNAEVILRVYGQEYGRYEVKGSITPGVNFLFRVPLDDGLAEAYSGSAALESDAIQITVLSGGQERPVVQSALPDVGAAGDIIRIDVTAGTDADGDGLSDEWEQWIVDYDLNDAITNIVDVKKDSDFDADGAPNSHEFAAGTDPTWDVDKFFVEEFDIPGGTRLRISFLTVPGKIYRVTSADSVATGTFEPIGYALSPDGELLSDYLEGDGAFAVIYVEGMDIDNVRFYRLSVQ